MRTPKESKQIPRDRTPKSTAGTIPKAALKAAWLKTKEQTRTAARENDTDTRQQEPTDLAGSAAEQSAAFVRHQGRKLAETQARQHRQKEAVARAHTAGERGVSPKQAEYGTLPDAAQRPRRGADLPRQRAKEKAVTAKTAPRDIRGVTQGQRQLHTAANETVRSVMTQAQMQTHAQKNTACRAKGCERHRQNNGGGMLGYPAFSRQLAQPSCGHRHRHQCGA